MYTVLFAADFPRLCALFLGNYFVICGNILAWCQLLIRPGMGTLAIEGFKRAALLQVDGWKLAVQFLGHHGSPRNTFATMMCLLYAVSNVTLKENRTNTQCTSEGRELKPTGFLPNA